MTISQANKADGLREDRSLPAEIKLYYDLSVPDEDAAPHPLLIALHGYGANQRQMMREERLIEPADFRIASLQGRHEILEEPKEEVGPYHSRVGWLAYVLAV